jgi:hypothetical protein
MVSRSQFVTRPSRGMPPSGALSLVPLNGFMMCGVGLPSGNKAGRSDRPIAWPFSCAPTLVSAVNHPGAARSHVWCVLPSAGLM